MQFWTPDDEHMCSKHVEAWNKTYCKTKILWNNLVNYWDKYTEMHGQQNVNILDMFITRTRHFNFLCLINPTTRGEEYRIW